TPAVTTPAPAPKVDGPKPSAPIPSFPVYDTTPQVPPADKKPADPPPGVVTPPAAPPVLPPPPPAPAKPPEPKEKTTGSVKVPEWPTEIGGKRPADYVKDLTDLDPFIRKFALQALPAFGPSMKKEAGVAKGILARMDFQKELDPGVRAAAFEAAGAIGFDDERDFDEAVRLLFVTADQGQKGGASRLYAVQALTTVGPRAWKAVPVLITPNVAEDPAFETRQAVATCLGAVAFNEYTGPSPKALTCLAEKLAHDRSAAVRLAAMQSLVLLGPPLAPRPPGGTVLPLKDIKDPRDMPKRDEAATAKLTESIRRRLVPVKGDRGGATGLVEKDPQVEVFVRLALMRFDPKEIDDENLSGITKYLGRPDTGVKLVALNSLTTLGGEPASRKIDDVVKALSDEHPLVVAAAATCLVAMGDKAKPALPALEKLKDRPGAKEEKEQWAKLSAEAVRLIREAGKPPPPAPPPAAKDGKK
ncbi:MAG: HEAT repeat domain-containing protein, partial [Gemmataceae bacterium]|nr:HEAT repeat domain-containing protein [Gemmataceae bacterium]